MSYMTHIITCNRHNLETFKPFDVDGVTIGHVRPAIAAEMTKYPDIFVESERSITFTGTVIGFERRSSAMARVVADLAKSGLLLLNGENFILSPPQFQRNHFFNWTGVQYLLLASAPLGST